MKYALVLQGGGFKGIYYAGAMNALLEKGIEPDMVLGSSTGAVFGAFIAMRKYSEMTELCHETGEMNGSNIFKDEILKLKSGGVGIDSDAAFNKFVGKLSFWDKAKLIQKKYRSELTSKVTSNLMNNDSLMSNEPLFELLQKHVKAGYFVADFWIAIVSLKTGQLHTVKHTEFKDDYNLNLGILASSNIPVLFKPVAKIELKDGTIIEDCVDGGLKMSSPITLAFQQINESFEWTVIAWDLSSLIQPINTKKKTTVVQIGMCVDIATNDGFSKDFKMTTKINKWALENPEWAKKNGIVYAKLLSVPVPVDNDGINLLGSVLDARKEWIDKRIQIGYHTVSDFLIKNIHNEIT